MSTQTTLRSLGFPVELAEAATNDMLTPEGQEASSVLRETSGPTNLSMGAVANGEMLVRSGNTIIGAEAASDFTGGTVPNATTFEEAVVVQADLETTGTLIVTGGGGAAIEGTVGVTGDVNATGAISATGNISSNGGTIFAGPGGQLQAGFLVATTSLNSPSVTCDDLSATASATLGNGPSDTVAMHGGAGAAQHAAIANVTDEASVVAAFNLMLAHWRARGDIAT